MFEIDGDLTDHPVVTIVVQTPEGTLRFMGDLEIDGSTMTLRGVHVQDAWANAIGAGNLKLLARTILARMDLDELVVEGAPGTTGASPGRRPRVLRFSRHMTAELAASGIAAAPVDPPSALDVRALRASLRSTREQFAVRYGLDVESIRNWEAGRREPDLAARSYLRAIKNDLERVEQAYAPTPSF